MVEVYWAEAAVAVCLLLWLVWWTSADHSYLLRRERAMELAPPVIKLFGTIAQWALPTGLLIAVIAYALGGANHQASTSLAAFGSAALALGGSCATVFFGWWVTSRT